PAILFDLLALTNDKPHAANAGDPKGTASIFPQSSTVNSGILCYLFLPQIEAAVEKLIRENLTAACKGGMRLSDRRKRRTEIATRLEAIRKERAELAAGLSEAARHIQGAPEAIAKGPSATDLTEANRALTAKEQAEAAAALAAG